MIVRPKIRRSLTELTGVNPEPALSLEAGHIMEADWSGSDLSRATFDEVVLTRVDLTGSKVRTAGLSDVRFEACELAGADLLGTTLDRGELNGLRATGAVCAEAQWRHVTVSGCKLDLMNFRAACLKNVHFTGCSLREADFADAVLSGVTFTDCDLTASEWSGARCEGVDLRSSVLVDLSGLAGLAGATISTDQLMTLAGSLAASYGLKVQ